MVLPEGGVSRRYRLAILLCAIAAAVAAMAFEGPVAALLQVLTFIGFAVWLVLFAQELFLLD